MVGFVVGAKVGVSLVGFVEGSLVGFCDGAVVGE